MTPHATSTLFLKHYIIVLILTYATYGFLSHEFSPPTSEGKRSLAFIYHENQADKIPDWAWRPPEGLEVIPLAKKKEVDEIPDWAWRPPEDPEELPQESRD